MAKTHTPDLGKRAHPRQARGSVMLIGLLLVLMTTALALTALKATKTEERLAGNSQDREVAFQAAEAAMREAERLLEQPALPSLPRQGWYRYLDDNAPEPLDLDSTNSIRYTRYDELLGINGDASLAPRYIIEEMGAGSVAGSSLVIGTRYDKEWRTLYRITVLGLGGSATTRAVLQSTFRR